MIIGIILIVSNTNNSSKAITKIEWDYMPSTEYYELRLAALTSEAYGAGSGTLSIASFNTLGKDVKNAGGKWFKNSNVNFKTKILDEDSLEAVSLTDGEYAALFLFDNQANYVLYAFGDEEFFNSMGISHYNLLSGYRITIK